MGKWVNGQMVGSREWGVGSGVYIKTKSAGLLA